MHGWHQDCLLERNISRTTADNVRIICICSDNMRMTCKYANNMWTMSRCDMQRKPSTQIISQIIYMILKWNNSTFLYQIPFNNWFLSRCKDSLELWWPWGVLQTRCGWHTRLRTMRGWRADDMRTTRGRRARVARCSTGWNWVIQASWFVIFFIFAP